MGKCGIVDWFPSGGSMLWFRDTNPMLTTGDDTHVRPPSIQVPAIMVQRMHLPPTIKFMRDRGYDVRPGDVVSVARGPEYEATGVMQSVNVPEACLTILSTRDHTIVSSMQLNLNTCYNITDQRTHQICDEIAQRKHGLIQPCHR